MDEFELAYLNYKKEEALINKRKELYEDLAYFEAIGSKDSEDFKETMSSLSNINDLIKDCMDIEEHKLLEMINASVHLKNELLLGQFDDQESIIRDSKDLPNRYLFNRIFNRILQELESLKKEEELQKYSEIKYGVRLSSYLIYCDNLFNDDINRVYLSMIQDSINTIEDENIKYELIEAKYNLIFLNDYLESEMLMNNFEVDNNIPIMANFYMRFTDIPNEINASIFGGIILDNLKKTQFDLKKHNVKGKLDSKNILRTCFMRANLFMLDEESVIKSNVEYYDEISKRKSINPNGDILITDTYAKALKDKTLYRGISIK
ncbi:MAG: hypothetical protein GX032_01585 [Tenericutes bacterium]|nr:hypothetical protein [Bacilli bacterium]NLV90148.1 hypothetical protein [Mycoplasmatota bacterium]